MCSVHERYADEWDHYVISRTMLVIHRINVCVIQTRSVKHYFSFVWVKLSLTPWWHERDSCCLSTNFLGEYLSLEEGWSNIETVENWVIKTIICTMHSVLLRRKLGREYTSTKFWKSHTKLWSDKIKGTDNLECLLTGRIPLRLKLKKEAVRLWT
jgi:hypothetical protein